MGAPLFFQRNIHLGVVSLHIPAGTCPTELRDEATAPGNPPCGVWSVGQRQATNSSTRH
jgi:hypothetical protein